MSQPPLNQCADAVDIAIEPIVDHLKIDGLLRRNRLKGALGDAMHTILCGADHNIRLIIRQLRIFCPEIWRQLFFIVMHELKSGHLILVTIFYIQIFKKNN
jgi:hypothetical protein